MQAVNERKNYMRRKKGKIFLSWVLMITMVFSTFMAGITAYAENTDVYEDNFLCEHHTEHTVECGYLEAGGHPCNHEHTDECYYSITKCIHEHTEECYSDGILPEPQNEKEADACIHQCSEESGCVERILNCLHEHNELCGYSEYTEGHPCEYVCDICSSNEEKDEKICVCTSACNGETVNDECPVCIENFSECSLFNENNYLSGGTIETYEQLADAIANASGDTELNIKGSIEIEDTIIIKNGSSIVLNGGGELYPSKALAEKSDEAVLIKIEAGGKLTIDGIVINGRCLSEDSTGTETGIGILIDCEGDFIFNSGRITGALLNTSNCNIGVVMVHGESASFEMYDGYIEDNVINCLSRCASVTVTHAAKFDMYGGYIQNNNCTQSGIGTEPATAGVMLISDVAGTPLNSTAEFNMYDGYILNNKTSGSSNSSGGGVCLWGWDFSDWSRYISMKMEGGAVSGNETVYGGGGIFVYGLASLKMTGGEVSKNKVTDGTGGGICVYDGLKDESFGLSDEQIEYFSKHYNLANFVLDGGIISENTAGRKNEKGDNGCGGGIYASTMNAELIKGTVSNNYASHQGGGIYVGSTPYILHMRDTVINNNSASILGGGLWFCPTGDITSVVTNGSAIYNNDASPKESSAGDDIAIVPQGDTHYADLSIRMLGGGRVEWYRDGGITEITAGGNTNILGIPDLSEYGRYEAGVSEQINEIKGNHEGLAVKCIVSDNAIALAESQAKLWVTGNSSERGGGIGSNGGIIIGDPDKEYSLTVVKDWGSTPQNQQTEITVNLKIGDYVLDGIKLNENNSWTAVFEGLPDPASLTDGTEITVEEITPEGFNVSYSTPEVDSDARTIKITVTNTKNEETGSLVVSKTVKGKRGDKNKEFNFTVKLDDKTISGKYGEMVFENGKAKFTLKDGESITASGLPGGVGYKVVEKEADEDGYDTKAEGEEGTIKEGVTSEASFVNTKNGKPGEPIEPTDPEDPEDPEEPEKPTDPEDPEDPEEPEKPTAPEEPEEPDIPKEPDNPAENEKPKDNPKVEYVPQTGDSTNAGKWLIISFLSGAALIFMNMKRFIRRRR